MKTLRALFDGLGILCFLTLMVFVYNNREHHATVDFHFVKYEKVPVAMIVLGAMLAGSILALFFALPEWIRIRGKLRETRERGERETP